MPRGICGGLTEGVQRNECVAFLAWRLVNDPELRERIREAYEQIDRGETYSMEEVLAATDKDLRLLIEPTVLSKRQSLVTATTPPSQKPARRFRFCIPPTSNCSAERSLCRRWW
jgi:hypothetical protein